MRAWLVCKKCNIREWVNKHTKFEPCEKCGSARFLEDDKGQPMIAWSEPADPLKW